MDTTVYFVKNDRIVGVGQGFIAWGLVNGASILESMRSGWKSAQAHQASLGNEKVSRCDLVWREHMSKWFTTAEDLASFEYAVIMDWKIPSEFFEEMNQNNLDARILSERREAGLFKPMTSDELNKVFGASELNQTETSST